MVSPEWKVDRTHYKPRFMRAKLQNDPARRGLLSLRDPTGAAHAVGPPDCVMLFPEWVLPRLNAGVFH